MGICIRNETNITLTKVTPASLTFLVLDHSVLGPYKGGLRFHPTVDEGGTSKRDKN